MRQRRLALAMSQTELGAACGASLLQVRRFENGVQLMSATNLWRIAGALRVPVDFFFSGSEEDQA